MPKLAAALITAVMLGSPGIALAKHAAEPYTEQQTIDAAVTDARAYWGGNPACGVPTIHVEATSNRGQTLQETCSIVLSSTFLTFADPNVRDFARVCRALTHEWGHLVLGPAFFATVNPTDPAHSPDPTNIMNAAASVTPRTCLAHAPRVVRVGTHVYRTRGTLSADGMTLTTELG